MSNFKFIIPLQLKDLVNHSGKGEYRVENEYSVRDLKLKLNDVKSSVRHKGSNFVLEGGFDVVYSALALFHRDLPNEMKHSAFEALVVAMGDLLKITDQFINSSDCNNDREKLMNANRMKMTTYLFCHLVELLEADAMQLDTASAAMGKSKKGKKKNDMEDVFWNWDERRQEAVGLMFRLMNLNVHALFDPPIAEEEFVSLVGNSMFRFLENPTIGQQRCRSFRVSIFQVLGTLISKYNYSLSCRLKFVQGLKLFEHMSAPMAEAMEKFTLDFNCRTILMDVIREIDRVDVKEISRDTTGTKAISQFLIEVAERLPEQLQPCLSILVKHLDGESFTFRKSILSTFGEIVIKLYTGQKLEEAAKNARDQYLDHLEYHIHDVNAHVRSTALQVWGKLCLNNAIPLTRQHQVLKLVVGRLQDRTSTVRKQAVQLLTQLLQCNPFDASLCVDVLKERHTEESEKLVTLMPKDDAEERAKKWLETEKALHVFLKNDKENDADKDGLWENAEAGEIHERIRHHLSKNKFGSASSLLAAAKEKFPVFKKLEEVEKNPVIDGDSAESEDEEEEKISIVEQFRRIFFMPLAPELEPVEEDANLSPEMNEFVKQKHLVTFLQDAVEFASIFDQALPVVCTLLGSKQASDVTEAISFFVSAFEFGLLNAMMGVRQMLALIFSREITIQKAVVDAYKKLYINPVVPGNSANAVRTNNIQMVKNLMALICGATIGDLAGLEELMRMLVTEKDIDKNCFQVMWQFFTKVIPDELENHSGSSLILLGMVANAEPNIITSNINVLVEHGLGDEGRENFRLVHDACAVLLKIGNTKPSADCPPFRLSDDHELFVRLEALLFDGIDEMKDDAYVPMSQQAISVIYQLSETPDSTCSRLIKRLCVKMGQCQESKELNLEVILSRFLFVCGHIAVCHLNYLDVSVFGELKRRSQMRETKKENDKVAAKKKSAAPSTASRKRKSALETPRGAAAANGKAEDDVDEVVGAEADDTEAEFIRNICEKKTVTGDNLLALLYPIIAEICNTTAKFASPKLRASASLALAKFMLVSDDFCQENLQLFFTILEKSVEPVIRANIIVAAGDLSFRFPNTLEPWTPRMYACLRDESSHVRSNTLTVLTHLILNDMIKVKGQISDMALCIIDDETKISVLAKLFFTELSRKGNALYNVMPDIISRLSDPEAGIEETKFREIMKYIIGLIEKDKHSESLVEKLCQRFRVTKTERQWRDLAFCLSSFAYNDKALKKLMDNFECYSNKLHEDKVHEALQSIISASKKLMKAETKVIIEELTKKIEEERAKQVEDDTAAKRAANAAVNKNEAKKKPAAKSRRSVRKEVSSEEEEDEEEEEESEPEEDEVEAGEEEKENVGKKTKKVEKSNKRVAHESPKNTPKKQGRKEPAKKPVEGPASSDEDFEEEKSPPKTNRKKKVAAAPPPPAPTPKRARSTRTRR